MAQRKMEAFAPVEFSGWWQRRHLPNDEKVKKRALAQGLIAFGGGLMWLTEAGKTLRARGTAITDTRRKVGRNTGSEGGR